MLVDHEGKRIAAGASLHPSLSKNPQEMEIHNDCDGNPNCAVELRISQNVGQTGIERYIEMHLTEQEAEFLERWVKAAREKKLPFQIPFPGGTVRNAEAPGMIARVAGIPFIMAGFSVGGAKTESTAGLVRHTDGRMMRFTYKYDGEHIASFDEETLYLINKWGGVNDLLSFFDDYSGIDPNKMQIVVDWI